MGLSTVELTRLGIRKPAQTERGSATNELSLARLRQQRPTAAR